MATVLEFPSSLVGVAKSKFSLQRRALASSSPLTAYKRVQGPIDERWVVSVDFPPMAEATWRALDAFISRLDGEAGFVAFFDHGRPLPQGAAAGYDPDGTPATFSDAATFSDGSGFQSGATTAQLKDAAVAGSEWITLQGLTASQTSALKAGDMLAITVDGADHGFLHQVVIDSPSNASGEATVTIRPRVRQAAPAMTRVMLEKPRGVFMQPKDDAFSLDVSNDGFGRGSLMLIEAFEAIL